MRSAVIDVEATRLAMFANLVAKTPGVAIVGSGYKEDGRTVRLFLDGDRLPEACEASRRIVQCRIHDRLVDGLRVTEISHFMIVTV